MLTMQRGWIVGYWPTFGMNSLQRHTLMKAVCYGFKLFIQEKLCISRWPQQRGFSVKLCVLYSIWVANVCSFLTHAINRVRVCVCMCVHLSVSWPATSACWFICHMPRAVWNSGTIIHSSGLQQPAASVSAALPGLIYASDISSPPS